MSVLSYLENLASFLNIAENEALSIDCSIDTLHGRLGNYFVNGELKEQFKFGSSVRSTMLPRNADSRSDVDYMIVFSNVSNCKPQTFIARLKRFAESSYSTSEVSQSSPTVVLALGHIKFDLVPSYRDWNSLYIPAHRTSYTDWIPTDPLSFNNTVKQANKNNKFMLKPMIRLLKYWNANNDYIYESYLLEQKMAAASFPSCNNLKDYLFSAINNFDIWALPDHKRSKVERAMRIVINVRQYEQLGHLLSSETEIKKLLPELQA